ncbi:phosphotransferase enzyme family protein [Candidatus Thiosymbion oneisti]|uniref:phosphotransferase enzyme family protein n=1 Tax=Candidatus Thiosymbion oneisti TaxID=589554 RepID=UPI000A9A37EA|nr:phosphotransferase [Candidatus Thiosymbion oneisti]
MNESESENAAAVASDIVNRFALPTPVGSIEPHGGGLINATFLVTAEDARYILQRINDAVFPEPERIMSNLSVLAGHAAAHTGSGLRIPAPIAAWDGRSFVRDGQGGFWRLMEFIPNTRGLARIEDPEQAREVGRILGRFHVLVSDLPAERLAVTLPGFHVTPGYLERFKQVLAACATVPPEAFSRAIACVTARQAEVDVLEAARQGGYLPARVIHGDPKLDNILFDRVTGRAVSLIDLDTVQAGLVHYDVGDCLRSCCGRGKGSAGARFDLDLCRAILGAYADEIGDLLNTAEIELLFDAIRLIPFELALRFLTDHLEGDRYFRITERGQNLRKAGIQLALVEDIEGKEREIRAIVAACFGRGKRVS